MTYTNVHDKLLHEVTSKNIGEAEYIQAVRELTKDIVPIYNAHEAYKAANVLSRLCEPERVIQFRVDWLNDNHEIETNRGWRVQHSGLIGPYKGGLRFHPTVNLSVLKFLAFEQTFKNALTGLSIGGAKGGSDFNPKSRSTAEIQRFCSAFMTQLYRYIGPYTDVPAGDINVGAREIGFLYGAYRRITNQFSGALTGKQLEFGGSQVRTEATGFGLIYFLERVMQADNAELQGKYVCISGAGNVALHAAMRALQFDMKVITLSNSKGTLVAERGLNLDAIKWLLDNRHRHDNPLQALVDSNRSSDALQWFADNKPWSLDVNIDVALPCATQNELDQSDACSLLDKNCQYVLEGANMPCTDKAIQVLSSNGITHVPGKACNAGGVALSSLEMSQNADFTRLTFTELDTKLRQVMHEIHDKCCQEGLEDDVINYDKGANIAAFRVLADAMVAQAV